MSETFHCHSCGGSTYRVIVDRRRERAHRTTSSPVAAGAYACTNRGTGSGLCVVECSGCRLRALHPMPDGAAVERAYADVEDPTYVTIEPHRQVAFQKLLDGIGRYASPPGRLLDVGCYTGLFPLAAQAAGWEVFGLEPSRWAATLAETRLPGRVTTGYLRDAVFPEASFDIITSWDVIEHVTDPRGDLQRMARLLKPGGRLFLSTMASAAPIVRLLGARWPWYMEMHRFYFTPETLGRLLTDAGLVVRAIEPYPHYTSLRYIFWKLESVVGAPSRLAGGLVRALGVRDRTIKVDLGDFFLAVAERVGEPAKADAEARKARAGRQILP